MPFFQDSPPVHYEYVIPGNSMTNSACELHVKDDFIRIPKVQIFFDINGTITCMDSVICGEGLSDHQLYTLLCIDIAKQVEAEWESGLGEMHFVTYIEKHLLPIDPKSSAQERKMIRDLRDIEYRNIFNRMPDNKRDYWLEKLNRAIKKYKTLKEGKIFPSFFNLLEKINDGLC